jgi:hypothetical protein
MIPYAYYFLFAHNRIRIQKFQKWYETVAFETIGFIKIQNVRAFEKNLIFYE